jgi:predicted dienelactone hydrolase
MLALLTLWLPVQAAPADMEPVYAARGPHSVGVVDFTAEQGDYTLNATLWYPALNPDGAEASHTYSLNGLVTEGQALLEAQPETANGPYPLIIYSHGLFGARFESIHYVEHLASWGFVVMAADHIGSTFFDTTSAEDVVRSFGYRPQDVMRLIDHTEAINAEGVFAGLMDMNAVGVTGFSFGGYTTLLAGGAVMDSSAIDAACEGVSPQENALCETTNLQLLAETVGLDVIPQGLWRPMADERIKAVVALAPCCVNLFGTEGLAELTIPLMVIAGTADTTTPVEQNGTVAFESASSEESALVLIEDAGHEVYLDIYTGEIARAHDLIQHFTTAFFMSQLKDDSTATALLAPIAVNVPEITYTSIVITAE